MEGFYRWYRILNFNYYYFSALIDYLLIDSYRLLTYKYGHPHSTAHGNASHDEGFFLTTKFLLFAVW